MTLQGVAGNTEKDVNQPIVLKYRQQRLFVV
jgi:hypothetical protein